MNGSGPLLAPPAAANAWQGDFIVRLAEAFARATGRDLYQEAALDRARPGESAWNGNFALLTHRGGDRAILNYGNRFALDLFEADWDQFTALPSAATAPPGGDEAARTAMMEKVARHGFVSGYEGRRISLGGRRFLIQDTTIWRLTDPAGVEFGVAAFFQKYRHL